MSDKKLFVPKTPMDFQKMKLEKLMANPDKPVIIPETPKDRKGFTVPEFVRNVMGSSAGAGSGEFHVYRHLRRKEYTRQKMIDEKAELEKLDEEYSRKIDENKKKMEERTAKKRAKRLKQKARLKRLKALKGSQTTNAAGSKEESSSESESEGSEYSDEEKHNSSTESSRDVEDKDNCEMISP
ncbi:hypothetical protein JTE90_002788 [Oedothorax gibbosus]|uniref:PRKR-interacting protein 1 n=1 Tax=Oedothorax gibbosus TaxID=931172 RepID=A0AAV6UIY7_9ARAC|nr:hypothetical protein JTE90_002788 [Oedothorax gibbosus]